MEQQALCHGEKPNKMMIFATLEPGIRSAIGAAFGSFFHLL
jgi:hypothetical protein